MTMQINWIRCSDEMPPRTMEFKLIYRIQGVCQIGYGMVFHSTSEIHPEWNEKKSFIEWAPYTEEAWREMNSN